MCSLYSLRRTPEETRTLFNYVDQPDFPPRPYVAPGGPMAIVRLEEGQRRFALVRWGFIPSWTKEIKPGKPLINARGETVADKPSFRNAFRRRRCLVPADGFYEWQRVGERKQPFYISGADGRPLAFAGIWSRWVDRSTGLELVSCAVVTTTPNELMAPIHDRMPVVLPESAWDRWLDRKAKPARMTIQAPLVDPAWRVEITGIAAIGSNCARLVPAIKVIELRTKSDRFWRRAVIMRGGSPDPPRDVARWYSRSPRRPSSCGGSSRVPVPACPRWARSR